MGQEEELSESRTGEQGTLIALTPGQLVTLFATGPDVRATTAPVEVVLDEAKGAMGGKVSTCPAVSTSRTSRWRTHARSSSTTSPPVSSYTPRGTRTASDRSWPTGRRSGTRRAKQERALYQPPSVMQFEGDHGPSVLRIPMRFLFHGSCRRRLRCLRHRRERTLSP